MGAQSSGCSRRRPCKFYEGLIDGFEAFAADQFALNAPVDGGNSLREHLLVVYERTGRMPERLANVPALPVGCEQLWLDFSELHASRGSTGFGPARITFLDLYAWGQVNGATLSAWQLEAIRRADNAYLESLPKPKANN